jgi:hypothetical protein
MALDARLPLSPQFVTALSEPKVGGVLYDRMRNLFHISLAISPLFALTSRRFNNESHGRHMYLAVS